MKCRFVTLFILLIFLAVSLGAQQKKTLAQRVFKRQLISAQTGLPLSFVSIGVSGSSQTFISDIAGFFFFSSDQINDTIIFDRMSVMSRKMAKATLLESPIIELDETSYNLDDVSVYSTSSQAVTIMTRAKEQLPFNNPDQSTPYSCYVYHKMVFDIDTSRIRNVVNPHLTERLASGQNNHLLIIESLTEKNHALPDLNSERVITGRVSGFKNPSLEFIPSQIKPFAFYQKYISLLNADYLNPVSSLGLKLYQFKITNTSITEKGDTIYSISFSPKNKLTFKGLTGGFQIISGSYAILKVDGTGYADESNNSIYISETYQKEGKRFWFPALLEARFQLGNVTFQEHSKMPLLGYSKSYLTRINLEPEFEPDEFTNVILQQNSDFNFNDTIKISDFRAVPLTKKDSLSYLIVDSIGKANRYDRKTELARSLALGFVPFGYLKADYTKVIDYNKTEGFVLGLGLYTSYKISKAYSVGGYIKHGSYHNNYNWGSSLEYYLWQKHEAKLKFSYIDDVVPTNAFLFLDGFAVGASEAYSRFYLAQMDTYKKFSTGLESRFAQDFKANIYWNSQKSRTTQTIFLQNDGNSSLAPKTLEYDEFGAQIRWVYNEKFIKTPISTTAIQSFLPYIWFNYSYIKGHLRSANFSAKKFEFQIEQSLRTSGSMITTLRITTATIIGKVPNSLYYGAFGTYSRIGLEVPFTLTTMRQGEFMANHFAMAFIRHQIPLFTNSSHKFKPILSINTSAAVGYLNGNEQASFNKGYYESGILLDNLFKILFLKYGAGVYYRYGAYHLTNEIDNWAAKAVVEFSFGK